MIYLNKESDNCDILGQYIGHESQSESMISWKDSYLVESLQLESLIVFDSPELVEKSVFDRLNAIFEKEKFLNVYERGIDTKVAINEKCHLDYVQMIISCYHQLF